MLSDNIEMRITDALTMCGFDNSSYFTRQFKSVMGITPREFVKKSRAAGEGVSRALDRRMPGSQREQLLVSG